VAGAGDPDVLAVAGQQDRLLVTLDTDFGALLAGTSASLPSVLLIRRRDHRPDAIVAVVVEVLSTCGDALSAVHLPWSAIAPCECVSCRSPRKSRKLLNPTASGPFAPQPAAPRSP